MYFTNFEGIPSPIIFLISFSLIQSGIFQFKGNELIINNSYIEKHLGSE